MATKSEAAKVWQTGEVITAADMNALQQAADNALALAQTNEQDIASLESGTVHSMVADTQTPTVPDNLAVSVGLLPVWKAGADVLLRSGIVDVSATAETELKAGTVLATGLTLKASQTYAVWLLNGGTMEHNTVSVNSTGKSITLTADQTFPAGTTLMLITENEI